MNQAASNGGRGGGGGFAVETHVPGDPAAFHAMASYLRAQVGGGVRDLGDEVAAHRVRLAGTWTGQAGETFGGHAATLATACDGVHPHVMAGADEIDALGDTLREVQEGLANLRASAAAGGCRVDGSLIFPPVRPAATADPASDALVYPNPLSVKASERADAAVWARVVEEAEGYWSTWYERIDSTVEFATTHAADIVGFLSDFVTVAATRTLKTITARILQGQVDFLKDQMAREVEHQKALAAALERSGIEDFRTQEQAAYDRGTKLVPVLRDAEQAAAHSELPRGLSRGFDTLGVLATGVGVYADIQDGESTAQAVVSQGTGLGVGVLGAGGGIAAGTAIGTVIFPGVGTVGGAVIVGGFELAGGIGGSILGDAVVDHFWPDHDEPDRPSVVEQTGGTLLGYAGQVVAPPGEANRGD